MKITADTNVLVRAITADDARQSAIAADILAKAESVALALPALCELVWVLSQGYGVHPDDIGKAIRRLIESSNVAVNRPAVEAGLSVFDRGGDFADGVTAYEGRRLGSEMFVSFDRKAVKLIRAAGSDAMDPGNYAST